MKHYKNIVIKYGGSILKDETMKKQLFRDIIELKRKGYCPIIVHGGGAEINTLLEKLGHKPKFVHGLRATDETTMELVQMVLCGKVNQEIVNFINKNGGKAVGLSGKDGQLLLVAKLESRYDLGLVGEVEKVNPAILDLLKADFIPVISPVGTDKKGITYNINADEVAAAIASALGAKLILLTDVDGVLQDKGDPTSTISVIKTTDIGHLIDNGVITEGMIPKIKSCLKAIESGVKEINIVKGTQPHMMLKVMRGEKTGTKIL
jgi:acetylglutamate kinase